jgi:hypothetical protein
MMLEDLLVMPGSSRAEGLEKASMVVAEISMWLHFSTYNLILSLNWTQMPS